ncbi:JAB domain-containing protein [Parabacteroides goldsteinii]|uniref:JAB domain-containing protein n=1 Tax=Parabacteroides goldsteinii TaxID=328812 RepID=UPI002ABAAB30|nr:JAB domain-containing protein [Parabacteroides goldsteinii]MDZ3928877.1 JAB domain-containing protein [Parabacteroides goldsteinii]
MVYIRRRPITCRARQAEDGIRLKTGDLSSNLLLNRAKKVLGICSISEGGINETSADLHLIMQAAILGNAFGIILAHNHPSGHLKPSLADDQLTQRVKEVTKLCLTKRSRKILWNMITILFISNTILI